MTLKQLLSAPHLFEFFTAGICIMIVALLTVFGFFYHASKKQKGELGDNYENDSEFCGSEYKKFIKRSRGFQGRK